MKKCKPDEFLSLLNKLTSDEFGARIKAERRQCPSDLRRILYHLKDPAVAFEYLQNIAQQCPEMLPLAERQVKMAFLESAHDIVLKNRGGNRIGTPSKARSRPSRALTEVKSRRGGT